MGDLNQIAAMIPGMKPGALKDAQIDEKMLGRTEAIIKSMTRAEKNDPSIINGSRKKRIANGSGTSVEEVNKLLKQFDQIQKLMKQFSRPGKRGGMLGKKGFPF